MSEGIFTVPARRCKRCGGILTSEQGLRDGYGPCCLKKMREEELNRQFMESQYSFFDMEAEAAAATKAVAQSVQSASEMFRASAEQSNAAADTLREAVNAFWEAEKEKEENHEPSQE